MREGEKVLQASYNYMYVYLRIGKKKIHFPHYKT